MRANLDNPSWLRLFGVMCKSDQAFFSLKSNLSWQGNKKERFLLIFDHL